MGNSLLDIKPHKVSRSLRGYSVMFYGTPKSGKTTTASQFPGALILAFEKGYNAIPGVMAKPMNSWNDFKKALRELNDPAVKEVFQTIVIDTADIAYSYCKSFICSRESDLKNTYESISDIPYGQGYNMTMEEFDECIRKILQMDYGLVIISHSEEKTFKNESTGEEYSKIVPTLDKKGRLVCERTCDIIGFSTAVKTENGVETRLFMRETPRFVAGSRFTYTPDSIVFSYDNLVNAIGDAIDKEAEACGNGAVTSEKTQVYSTEPVYNFKQLQEEFQTIVGEKMASGDPKVAAQITQIIDEHLGKGKKVGDCTPEQAPQLDLIVFDLKNLK